MKKMLLVLAVGALAIYGCGGDDDEATSNPAEESASSGSEAPEWAQQIAVNELTRADDYNGHEVWIDEAEQTVFIKDCAAAEETTSEGGPYGPEPRNDDGSGGAVGWAHICQD